MVAGTQRHQRQRNGWHAVLLWVLALALPMYGASSTSLRLLGPAHWHAAPSEARPADDDWLKPALGLVLRVVQRAQELRAQAHARAHAAGRHHEHHGLLRHWHSADDSSVRLVDGSDPALGDLVAGAAVGSATLTFAPPMLPWQPNGAAVGGDWPSAPTPTWMDAEAVVSSPPPRT